MQQIAIPVSTFLPPIASIASTATFWLASTGSVNGSWLFCSGLNFTDFFLYFAAVMSGSHSAGPRGWASKAGNARVGLASRIQVLRQLISRAAIEHETGWLEYGTAATPTLTGGSVGSSWKEGSHEVGGGGGAKGRTGDCPGPRKGATTRRNVTQGGGRLIHNGWLAAVQQAQCHVRCGTCFCKLENICWACVGVFGGG